MNGNQNQLGLLDILTIVSFVVGIANYEETIDQNKLQDILNDVLKGVHEHLKEQDRKIDEILDYVKRK